MSPRLMLLTAIAALTFSVAACDDAATNSNANANANTNMAGARNAATPAPTATPGYTEAQAKEERARAKANKDTIGQSLEDAWIHTKIVAKLIGDAQTPERKINVDVVNGDVTLRGTVDTAEARSEAQRIAKETDGVKKVTNQLKLSPAAPKPAKTK